MKRFTVLIAAIVALCGYAMPVQAVTVATSAAVTASMAAVTASNAAIVANNARLASEESSRQLKVAQERQKQLEVQRKATEEPQQHAQSAKGYNSADSKYAKVCASDARGKLATIGAAYVEAAGYDYAPSLSSASVPSFPPAFRNPIRKEQYIHPIEFKVRMVRGFETRVRVMYSNSDVQSSSGCVFQGIEFLDMTDAN